MTVCRQNGWTRLAEGFTARWLDLPYQVGSRIMIDFGFGSFLEKFEHFYGKRASKIFVGFIAFVIIITLVSLIIKNVIEPIYNVAVGNQDEINNVFQFLITVLMFIYMAFLLASLVNAFKTKNLLREAEARSDLVDDRLRRANNTLNVLRLAEIYRKAESSDWRRIIDNIEEVTQILHRVSPHITEVSKAEAFSNDALAFKKALEELVKIVEEARSKAKDSTETPSQQSHPDTEEETQPKNLPG